ncbi:MAG: urease subunit beta [Alistipes sp.]|nr:urease subunit beta [Alistipes sp.]
MNDNATKHTPAAAAKQAAGLYPNHPGFKPAQPVAVGGEILASTPIEYNTGRKTVKLVVRNTGDRPIQVGSHFHFFEVNRYLEFDRDAAFGCHLNIPATTAIRFEPGDQKEVEVVTYAGKRRVIGFNGLVMGYTGDEDAPTYFPARMKALRKVRKAGFKEIGEKEAEAAYARQQEQKEQKGQKPQTPASQKNDNAKN